MREDVDEVVREEATTEEERERERVTHFHDVS